MNGPTEAPLLALRNLKTRFYTYEGTVQALDGIEFHIARGETFGLVGETGCGKSVTALSVMRLIPSPPGKIEEGEALFLMPPEQWARIGALEAGLEGTLSSLRSALKKTPPTSGSDRELLEQLDVALGSNPPRFELPVLDRIQASLRDAAREPDLRKEARDAIRELVSTKGPHDILSRPEDYMRKIRGNLIAMIFQEPMSALNPVIIAGDQIAENILLHQREELAKDVIADLDRRIRLLPRPHAVADVDPATGLLRCSRCSAEVPAEAEECGKCHSRFIGPARQVVLDVPLLKLYRALYRRIVRNPNDPLLKVVSRVPFLRRYERVMYRAAFDRAVEMLRAVRIPDPEKVASAYPFELSGGMAQRVMIAIALSCSPRLLIADEPTTAVDVTIQAQVLKLMKDLKAEVRASVLLITHNLGVVAETCDRVGVMYAGVMAEIGPTRSVFKEPLHPYTKGLMESIPRVTVEKDRLQIIHGNVPNLITPPAGCRFHPRCPAVMAHCGWASNEIRTRLEDLLETAPGDGGVRRLIRKWDDSDPAALALECSGNPKAVADWVTSAIAGRKGEDVAFQAVESVKVDGGKVTLRLISQRKPPMIEARPGHRVACYLYGGWPHG